jgi:hypothetical protein
MFQQKTRSLNSTTPALVLGLILGLNLAPSAARAQDEPIVSGVEVLKAQIRESAVRGAEGLRQLGPWKIRYTGLLKPGKRVSLAMQPRNVFATEAEADPRDFRVTMMNPSALYTPAGNLREMGIEIQIMDAQQGAGQSTCMIEVVFLSTGTRLPLPLAQIAARDPLALDLKVSPADAAEFLGYNGEKALFRRKSADRRPVQVTLRFNDGNFWVSYTSELAACTDAGGGSSVGGSGVILTPAPRPESRTRRVRFSLSNSSAETAFLKGYNQACARAKDDLFDLFLGLNDCQSEAMNRYSKAEAGVRVEVMSVDVVKGSQTSICNCRQRGDLADCWSCVAKGSLTCEAVLEETIRTP